LAKLQKRCGFAPGAYGLSTGLGTANGDNPVSLVMVLSPFCVG
jgi:hypothetical protein